MPSDSDRRGIEAASDRIMRGILDGPTSCVALPELLRAGRVAGDGRATFAAAEDLVLRGWLTAWSAPGGRTVLLTLTPRAAARIGVVLIQPEDEAIEEPRWGWPGQEPECFRAVRDPFGLRHTRTRFERIAAAVSSREPSAADQAAHDELVMIIGEGELGEAEARPLVLFGQVVRRDARMKPGKAG